MDTTLTASLRHIWPCRREMAPTQLQERLGLRLVDTLIACPPVPGFSGFPPGKDPTFPGLFEVSLPKLKEYP